MQFTFAEVRFLSQSRGGWADVSGLSIPPRLLQHILEYRAKSLGDAFERFRESNIRDAEVVPLELAVEGAKLF